MGAEFVTTLIDKTDRLARRLKQWNEWRVESELALERRTINLRIEQQSDQKGQQIAIQRLTKNKEWILSEQQRLQLVERRGEDTRRWLNWLFSIVRRSANTWIFFIGWTVSIAAWGWVGGINTPVGIICSTRESLCYSARVWGVKKAASSPKPMCTKTKLGLMCLVEPAAQTKTKPSATKSRRR